MLEQLEAGDVGVVLETGMQASVDWLGEVLQATSAAVSSISKLSTKIPELRHCLILDSMCRTSA